MAAVILISNLLVGGLVLWLTIESVMSARREAAEAAREPAKAEP